MEFDEKKVLVLKGQQLAIKQIFNSETNLRHELINAVVNQVINNKELDEKKVEDFIDKAKQACLANDEVENKVIDLFSKTVFGK